MSVPRCFARHIGICQTGSPLSSYTVPTGCILTTLTLSQATDPVANYDEVVGFYDRLIKIDPYRRGYYMDRRSEFITQVVLFRHLKNSEQMLDLSNKVRSWFHYNCPHCHWVYITVAPPPGFDSIVLS